MTTRKSLLASILLGVALTSCICVTVIRFAAAGRDDTFIMLWSGKAFTISHWFVNYNGASEEISSSTIAPLIAAIGFRITPSTPLLFFKGTSLLAVVWCLWLIWRCRNLIALKYLPEPLVPLIILSIGLSPMLEYWTLGGLETGFLTCLISLVPLAQTRFYIHRSVSREIEFAVALTLLSLIRTEGFMYAIASLAAVALVAERRSFGTLARPIVAALCATLGVSLIRFLFTGAIWPNPTYAKIGGTISQAEEGLQYVWSYYVTGGPASWIQGVGTIYATVVLAQTIARRARGELLAVPDFFSIVASAYVVTLEIFVIAAGGNWMEYFRFLVPTIPLKVLLFVQCCLFFAARSEASHPKGPVYSPTMLGCVLCICSSAMYQQSYPPPPYHGAGNCAAPMTDIDIRTLTLRSIEDGLLEHNCTARRDKDAILPFIRDELRWYVYRVGQIRVVTYQGGYFPFYIRKWFSPAYVQVIDSAGLTTRAIARVNAEKSSEGILAATDLGKILSGSAGELSEVILKMRPNMVYSFWATTETRELLMQQGYSIVWERPNAIVFFKDGNSRGPEASPKRDESN